MNSRQRFSTAPGPRISPGALLGWFVVITLGVLGTIGFGLVLSYDGDNIKTINGMIPLLNNFLFTPGTTGVSISSGASNELVIDTDAVRQLNDRTPISNQLLISAADSSIVIGTGAQNEVTIDNGGVKQAVAGDGMTVSSATGDVTVSHTISSQIPLPISDPNSLSVKYGYKNVLPFPENTWVGMVANPGLLPPYQGQGAGANWIPQSNGFYHIGFLCDGIQFVNPLTPADEYSIQIDITVGGTSTSLYDTTNPAGLGDIKYFSGTSPYVSTMSLMGSGVVHICPTCQSKIGDFLFPGVRHTRIGAGPANQIQAINCQVDIIRLA